MSDFASVAQDSDYASDCQERRCDDCYAEDCVCGCHLADPDPYHDDPWGDDDGV